MENDNGIENRKAIEKSQWNQKLIFEKINKTGQLLVRLIDEKGKKTEMINMKHHSGTNPGDSLDITKTARKQREKFYAKRWDDLNEMHKFFKRHKRRNRSSEQCFRRNWICSLKPLRDPYTLTHPVASLVNATHYLRKKNKNSIHPIKTLL